LVFASAGRYSPTRGGIRSEQLHWASQVGAPWRAPAITIDREIKGQHFARRGGEQGFRQYRSAVLSAARQAFNKRSAP
jgi:hypothetical protein